MAGKQKDLSGRVFGRLTVISEGPRKSDNALTWVCRCECGNHKAIRAAALKSGNTRSCGCLSGAVNSERMSTHGLSKHPAYKVWAAMVQRTTNPSDVRWADYGGRGISIDPRWLTFNGFWEDMGDSYSYGLSLDRIDVEVGYSKENCRWATESLQQHNRRKKKNTSSEYIGVNFHKKAGKFRAGIKKNGKHIHLGLFVVELYAAKAYDDASEEFFGDRPNGTARGD